MKTYFKLTRNIVHFLGFHAHKSPAPQGWWKTPTPGNSDIRQNEMQCMCSFFGDFFMLSSLASLAIQLTLASCRLRHNH